MEGDESTKFITPPVRQSGVYFTSNFAPFTVNL